MTIKTILPTTTRALLERAEQQRSALEWCRFAFASNGVLDEVEPSVRLLRFFEEATELAQAGLLPKELLLKQVEEVYSRPVGRTFQEIGGVMVTLMSYGESINVNISEAEQVEIERINSKPLEHFQRRQREKMQKGLHP